MHLDGIDRSEDESFDWLKLPTWFSFWPWQLGCHGWRIGCMNQPWTSHEWINSWLLIWSSSLKFNSFLSRSDVLKVDRTLAYVILWVKRALDSRLKNNFQIACGVATFGSSAWRSKHWITRPQKCDDYMNLCNSCQSYVVEALNSSLKKEAI
jgi:hypothetical protein